MVVAEVILAQTLVKKLQSLDPVVNGKVVYLFGWFISDVAYCVGCARISEEESLVITNAMFPAGVAAIGVYLNAADMSEPELMEYLSRKASEGSYEECLIGRSVLAVSATSESNGKNLKCYSFELSPEKLYDVSHTVADAEKISAGIITARISGQIPIQLESAKSKESTAQNVADVFSSAKSKVLSPCCAFRILQTPLLLVNKPKASLTTTLLNNNSLCGAIAQFLEKESDGFEVKTNKKKKGPKEIKEILKIKLLFNITGEDAVNQTVSHTPIIHYERREFLSVSFNANVDMVASFPTNLPLQELSEILASRVTDQLQLMQSNMVRFLQDHGKLYAPKVFHFKPSLMDHTISIVYPEGVADSSLEAFRSEIHDKLMLPSTLPFVRRSMNFVFPEETYSDHYLRNTHIGVQSSGITNGEIATVQGTYSYHHYMQDNFDDKGWGCAYRSLQTLVSWYRHQGYTDVTIPTHTEIQQALVDIGDKPASFVSSRKWIGSTEVSFCLDRLLGVQSRIMFVNSGAELANKGRELLHHFKMQGTPIMIGGGVYAHTILGVHFNEGTSAIKFLILDPHYTGSEDLALIQGKGWCGWKGQEFWDKTAYYNLCMPFRPRGI